jgi:hypothetical protein
VGAYDDLKGGREGGVQEMGPQLEPIAPG